MRHWGIDYASIDNNASPDWKALRTAGCAFVWIRASYAYLARNGWVLAHDPHFQRDWKAAADAGMVRGAYAFIVEQAGTPEAQIRVFADAVKAAGGLRPGLDFPPCYDLEFPNGIAATGRDRHGVLDFARQAVALQQAALGCKPITYTSGRVWNGDDSDCLGSPAVPLTSVPPWLARYPYATREAAVLPPPTSLSPAPLPAAWGDAWIAHQYQGDALHVPGMTSTVDLDVFRDAVRGDHGGHVAWFQAKIRINSDGAFGPQTEQAVQTFQAHYGIPVSGSIDPATFAAACWLPD